VTNPDTTIRYINPAMEKLTGFSKEEIINRKAPYPWWPKDTASKMTAKLKQVILNGTTRVDCCFRNKMGDEIWAEVTAAPIKKDCRVKFLVSNLVDITERKRMREGTESYLREVTRIQEEERKRIARELHDDTAQSLAYLALELDSIINSPEITSSSILQRLKFLKQQTNNSLQEVRRFSHELRPGVLDQLGLISAIELLVDELNARNQFSIQFGVTGQERRFSNEEEQALFRIAQEALSNIRKHSQATKAEVNIKFTQNKIRLTIRDNGKGFQSSKINDAMANGRLGLIGMKERAHLIGAVLSLKSAPDKGTRVSVNLNSKLKSAKYTV
jgi:two-component system, NarL family, sensor histidine kinase DegS